MGQSPVDRNRDYMREMWGTTKLVSDYGSMLENDQKKMLREIANDKLTPKKSDKLKETEIFETDSDPEPLFE